MSDFVDMPATGSDSEQTNFSDFNLKFRTKYKNKDQEIMNSKNKSQTKSNQKRKQSVISEHTVTVNDSSKKQDNKLSPEEILSSEDHDAATAPIDTIGIGRKEHVQKFIDASAVHIANYAKLTCDIRVFKELKSDKSKEPISEELSETLSKKKVMQKKWQKIFQTIVSLNFAAFVKRKIQKRKWFLEFIVRKKYITQRLENYMR